MASADPDGRLLQALTDRLTCLGMEMAEHLRDAHRRFDAVLPDPPSTDTTQEDR